MQACIAPPSPTQQWDLSPATGALSLRANTSLCLHDAGTQEYPLTIQSCAAPSATAWRHDAKSGEVVNTGSGACLDLRLSDNAVGTWQCGERARCDGWCATRVSTSNRRCLAGSGEGLNQLNQEYSVDPATGIISSMYGAGCLTAGAPPM